jgi:hypothetical protein
MQVISCSCAGCLVAICGLLLRSQALVSAARSPNFEAHDPGLENSNVSEEIFWIIIMLIIFLAAPSLLTAALLMRTKPWFKSFVCFFRDKTDKIKRFLTLRLFPTQSASREGNQSAQQNLDTKFSPTASSKDDLSLDFSHFEMLNHEETGNAEKKLPSFCQNRVEHDRLATLDAEMVGTKLQIELLQKKLAASLTEIQVLKSENQTLRFRLNDHDVLPLPLSRPGSRIRNSGAAGITSAHECITNCKLRNSDSESATQPQFLLRSQPQSQNRVPETAFSKSGISQKDSTYGKVALDGLATPQKELESAATSVNVFNLPPAPPRSRKKLLGRATEAACIPAGSDLVEFARPAAAGSHTALSFKEQPWTSETKPTTLACDLEQQPHSKKNPSKKTNSNRPPPISNVHRLRMAGAEFEEC